ncbi:YegP family protein [Sphingobacterium multivorum]|uniref:YegP family protein n=1 Tax=Sphingobacterium multivorum TaxID=28454 RepID=UPI0028999971|nr:YegP family protein [Sphingobacterium multivorum]
MGKFVVSKRFNGTYQFNLKAGNGQIILSSEGYTQKSSCLRGIESVIRNSKIDDNFERRTSTNGKFYFNLKAEHGQIIGTSELYESSSARENGIQSVKVNAPNSPIDDFTS